MTDDTIATPATGLDGEPGLDGELGLTPTDDGCRATLSEAWGAYGPNGGLLAGLALAAARRAEPARRPQWLQATFLARSRFGDLDLGVRPVRRAGRSVYEVTGRQDGDVVATATAVLADPGDPAAPVEPVVVPPRVTDPDLLPTFDDLLPEAQRQGLPAMSRLVIAPAYWTRHWPPAGGVPRRVVHWVRAREPVDPAGPAPHTLALVAADVHAWLAVAQGRPELMTAVPRTLALNAVFTTAAPTPWLLVEAQADHLGADEAVADVRVHDEDRRLLALVRVVNLYRVLT